MNDEKVVVDDVVTAPSSSSKKVDDKDLPPIVFVTLGYVKQLLRFPRSPQNIPHQVKLDDIDRDSSFFVFVSHCWLRGYDGAPGYDGRPHPDTANHDKMKLIIEAVDKMLKSFTTKDSGFDDTNVYLWLDYGCINQDATAFLEISMLDQIIQACDVMLTPIYDDNLDRKWWDDIKKISNMYNQYGSPGWNQGVHSYLNRAWCRVEMMYASNIPVVPSKEERSNKFTNALSISIQQNRRPHVIYGTNESVRNMGVIVLPPLQNSFFDEFSPVKGNLTKDSDMELVKVLVKNIEGHMKYLKVGYVGETNEAGLKHNRW